MRCCIGSEKKRLVFKSRSPGDHASFFLCYNKVARLKEAFTMDKQKTIHEKWADGEITILSSRENLTKKEII